VIRRLLLGLERFFLEHPLCGDLDGGPSDERASLACVACGARIERPMGTLSRYMPVTTLPRPPQQ